jgi:hypothetical protein
MNLIATVIILICSIIQLSVTNAQVTPITAPVPTITVSPTYLSFGAIIIGKNSSIQSFKISGTYLKNNIVVTAPAGFEINDNQKMYPPGKTTLTLVQAGGNVDKTIYVVFKPVAERVYLGTITCVSQGVKSKGVNVTGEGVIGILTVSPTNLSFGEVEIGKPSFKTYQVSGTGISSDVFVTAPSGYLIAPHNILGQPYKQTMKIAATAGWASMEIDVMFIPTSSDAKVGYITHVSGKLKKDVLVSGKGIPPIPEIYVYPGILRFWGVTVGNSKVLSYTLRGKDLVGDISIMPYQGYTVSSRATGPFASGLSIPKGNGVVDTTIYVKFSPNYPILYNTRIPHESAKASTEFLDVYGLGKNQSLASSAASSDNPTILKSANLPSINLYPNPASDQFTILLNQIVPEQITILNWAGRTVLTVDKSLLNNSEIVIQAGQLPPGTYLVNIRSASGYYTQKLLINR